MLVGAIIGVGIFGIPYVSSRAGFWVGEGYIVGLFFLVLLLHLCFAEIVERTQGSHRIVGYAGKYCGKKLKYVTFFLAFVGGYMALLLYIVAAGKFLNILTFNEIPATYGSILFWILGTYALWRGLRFIATGEFFMAAFFLLAIGVVVGRGIPLVHALNFTPFNFSQIFLPYGVVLFALTGTFAIPEMRIILKDGKKYVWTIITGTAIPAIVYLLFNFAIVGMSGPHTSPEAIQGILPIVGEGVGWIAALAGFFAVSASFLAFSLDLKNTLAFDWRMHHIKATLVVALVPIFLFLLGFQQLIAIMSVAGAVFGAAMSVIILLVYLRAKRLGDRKPAFSLGLPAGVVYTVIAAMVIAGAYQIVYWIY